MYHCVEVGRFSSSTELHSLYTSISRGAGKLLVKAIPSSDDAGTA